MKPIGIRGAWTAKAARLARWNELTNTRWLILQHDLSLPLEVVEASALIAIRNEREIRIGKGGFDPIKSRALSKEKYVEYLRILDGAAGGFSAQEIGTCIALRSNNLPPDRPRDKRFRAALKEALRLQTGGYRVLPLLEKADMRRKKK